MLYDEIIASSVCYSPGDSFKCLEKIKIQNSDKTKIIRTKKYLNIT